MRRLVLVASLAGCSPALPDDIQPDAMPLGVVSVPDGAWEPDPGLGRNGARLVADGAGIWFAYGRAGAKGASEVWLTKLTSTGDMLVPTMRIDGPELAGWPMSIAHSGDNVAVLWEHSSGGLSPRLRLFDRDGQPLSASGSLVPVSPVPETYMTNVALASRADGTLRMFATYEYLDMTTELGAVDIDATGTPVGAATLFGIADAGAPQGLAAVDAAGSTVVAWDRRYNECYGFLDPDAVVTTTVTSSGTVGGLTDINPSGRDDREPALAALGPTAYLAWTGVTDAGSVIRVARALDASTGFIELGNPALGNQAPLLALADATHGAVAWRTYEPSLRVASLTDDGAHLVMGPANTFQLPANTISLDGIVHIDGERYLVAWTQGAGDPVRARMYALVVDLALAPNVVPDRPVSPSAQPRSRRCSH